MLDYADFLMINKTVRITLDFDVTVSDQVERVSGLTYASSPQEEQEFRSRQQVLLDAMLRDPETIKRWIISGVLSEFEGAGIVDCRYLVDALHIPLEDESDLFAEAVTELPEADRQFWEMVERDGVFPENSMEVSASLKVRLVGGHLEELQPAHA